MATSGQVTVEVRKHVWNVVSVVPNPQTSVVPGSIQFVATLDHSAYGTPYDVYIYDEDSTGYTSCNQQQCGLYIGRQWADNVSPKPGRVRVEVRNSTGDVASDTVYASASFRRFIFTVNLAFSTQTDANGNVVHEATASTAATDPSLYGTPYRIKTRRPTAARSAPALRWDASPPLRSATHTAPSSRTSMAATSATAAPGP